MYNDLELFFNKQHRVINANYSKEYIKKNGIFLTHDLKILDDLIKFLFETYQENEILNLKFLEPSVGTGNIIIYFIQVLRNMNVGIDKIINFVENNIFINELDNSLLSIAVENIENYFSNVFGKKIKLKHIYNIDFTDKEKISSTFINKFDVILGNPPFVSLYGKNGITKTEETRKKIINEYIQFPNSIINGKINISMLFIENSLSLLNDNGILSFILDSSFFDKPFYFTRKFIYQNWNVHSLFFNYFNFMSVYSGQIIININKKSNNTKLVDIKHNTFFYIENENIIKNDYIIPLKNPKNHIDILKKIYNKSKPLAELYNKKIIRTGTMLLNMENEFVNKKCHGDSYVYYKGSKSLPRSFELNEIGLFFTYDKEKQNKINDSIKHELTLKGIKNKKRIGFGEKEIYDNPKIFIRQSANNLIAAFDDKKSSCDNSLYIISFRSNFINATRELKFLVGYLNSEIANYYAQLKIIKLIHGKQPQMRISDFINIPICYDENIKNKIIDMVDIIIKSPTKKNEIINDINILLYEFYELNNEKEITQIRSL